MVNLFYLTGVVAPGIPIYESPHRNTGHNWNPENTEIKSERFAGFPVI
jgi:hypothetical protein